ncbi:MAG: thioredoxin [Patescibacteria group bacterium]|nr:thioredoxin [Patescibacteria group bacterium]
MAAKFTDDNFDAEVLKSKTPVLVDFYADWCGPCQMLTPVIDELADEYEGKVKIGKLDVDESPETAGKYGVMSIPALIFFKNGEEVSRGMGFKPKDVLKEELDRL